MDTNGNDEIGFGKPPKRTQFKKGQSGNPRGRPKGKPNIATVLERALREKVVINENGRRKIITKLEASIKQLVNKAAAGDLRAMQQLAALKRAGEERAAVADTQGNTITNTDERVMQGVLRRFGATREEAEDAKSDPE
jgi:hypothetical protein